MKMNGKTIIQSEGDFIEILNRYQDPFNKDLYHYTTWSSLAKMMKPVEVEYDEEFHSCRMLWLGNASQTNDRTEKDRLGKSVFISCFIRESKENVAMWSNYGIPKVEAVRIRLDKRKMLEWYENFLKTKRIYRVDINERGLVSYSRIWENELEGIDIKFDNVHYLSSDVELHDKQIERDWIDYKIDGHHLKISGPLFSRMPNKVDECFHKKMGWSYEKEVRLAIRFKGDVNFSRIAVEFDEPLNRVLKCPWKSIQRGPWYSSARHYADIEGISVFEVAESAYQDELNMRSICSGCERTEGCFCERRDVEIKRRIKPENERIALEELKRGKKHQERIDDFLRCVKGNIASIVAEIGFEECDDMKSRRKKCFRCLEALLPTRDSVLEWIMCESRRKLDAVELEKIFVRCLKSFVTDKEDCPAKDAVLYLKYEIVLYTVALLLRVCKFDVVQRLVDLTAPVSEGLSFRGVLERLNPSRFLDMKDDVGNDVSLVEWMRQHACGGPEIMPELAYADFCLFILVSSRYGHCSWLPAVFDAYKVELVDLFDHDGAILSSARELPFENFQKVLQGKNGVTFPRQREFLMALNRIHKTVSMFKYNERKD